MINLDKKDLKLRIQNLYKKVINSDDFDSIISLDIVKSILGIDIDNINPKILNWYTEQLLVSNSKLADFDKFDNIPEAISFFNLENCLLEKKYNKALECVYHLSVVSEGRQILEFFIEFSLRYTDTIYRYIWHIFRMQVFLDSKTMLMSLNKCVELIISSDINTQFNKESNTAINWIDYLSLDIENINNLFLLYSIYNTELTRSNALKKIIATRLLNINVVNFNKIEMLNVKSSQRRLGREWILNFINNCNSLNFNMLELLNGARSALMLSKNMEESDYIWTHLNNKL